MNEILFEQDGPIATVAFNRPAEHNAIDFQMWTELVPIFQGIAKNSSLRVVIVRGVGNSDFSAGADIKEFPKKMRDSEMVDKYWQIVDEAHSAIENCPQVVIAMINGVALGAGCALAVACDVRIAASNARLGVPAAHLGLTLGLGDTRRLVFAVGATYARAILLTSERYQAEDACRMELVTEVVPPEKLEERTMHLARRIAGQSAPLALQEAKLNIATVMRNPGLVGVYQFAKPIAWAGSMDLIEGVTAYFQRRRPHFTGK